MAIVDKSIVYGKLDGLNDYTAANSTKAYIGAKMKQKNVKKIAY